jgi:translation initiation factor 4B
MAVCILERHTRERRPPAALPDEPPFTAYIGNLPYDLSDEDVEEFFGNTQVSIIT